MPYGPMLKAAASVLSAMEKVKGGMPQAYLLGTGTIFWVMNHCRPTTIVRSTVHLMGVKSEHGGDRKLRNRSYVMYLGRA